jgi:hypothetical protein
MIDERWCISVCWRVVGDIDSSKLTVRTIHPCPLALPQTILLVFAEGHIEGKVNCKSTALYISHIRTTSAVLHRRFPRFDVTS